MSSAISIPCCLRRRDQPFEVVSVPSFLWIALWPPSLEPIAHGLPSSPFCAVTTLLFLPLRNAVADWTDRRHVQHIEAHRRNRGKPRLHILERSVRCVSPSTNAAADRGNNSYQVEYRARSRSPRDPSLRCALPAPGRSTCCRKLADPLGRNRVLIDGAAFWSAIHSSDNLHLVQIAWRSPAPLARFAARSSSSAPIRSARGMSCDARGPSGSLGSGCAASRFFRSYSSRCRSGPPNPAPQNCHAPSWSTTKLAVQISFPSSSPVERSRHLRSPFARYRAAVRLHDRGHRQRLRSRYGDAIAQKAPHRIPPALHRRGNSLRSRRAYGLHWFHQCHCSGECSWLAVSARSTENLSSWQILGARESSVCI